MQQLAGLLTEAEANRKYYAIINTSNKYTSKSPLYFSTDSKEDMISTLNKLYKEMTGKNNSPYTLDDINPYSKMNDFAGMSNMVFEMLDNGWADEAICNELGMESEELLRLKHITGFSKLFKDVEYQKAWESKNQLEIRKKLLEEQKKTNENTKN
jgi:hypothetical protein